MPSESIVPSQCNGNLCPRKENCQRYAKGYFTPDRPFGQTLCEWVGGTFVDRFEPIEVVELKDAEIVCVDLGYSNWKPRKRVWY